MQQIVPALNAGGPRRVAGPDTRRRALTRVPISLLIVGVCVAASGCGPRVIWSAESRSPDGMWLASGQTLSQRGPGNNNLSTVVYLKPADGSENPREILTLLDGPIVPPSVTGVKMEWLTPRHLELTYLGGRPVGYQATDCSGIHITARELSHMINGPSSSRRYEEAGRALENKR